MSALFDNIKAVRDRIEAAASRAGRDPAAVELTAVTKRASTQALAELASSGLVRHIGENRVQDASRKAGELGAKGLRRAFEWRMIGHLQGNKAGKALEVFDSVDSLDSLGLADALERRLAEEGRTLPVLVQVKLTGRETQSGIGPEALPEFLAECRKRPRLRVRGLMAIAPFAEPAQAARPYFRRMRELFELHFRERDAILSMGMSRDFEIAVEEGAGMVRLGSVLFVEGGTSGAVVPGAPEPQRRREGTA